MPTSTTTRNLLMAFKLVLAQSLMMSHFSTKAKAHSISESILQSQMRAYLRIDRDQHDKSVDWMLLWLPTPIH